MAQIFIIAPILFFAGAILLLERQALGKLAFVQPLVLLFATGFITGEQEIAIWLGITLQLLSIGQSHYCNWALVSFISSASLIILNNWGLTVAPGSAQSLVLVITSILIGIQSEFLHMKVIRKNALPMKANPIWHDAKSLDAFSKIILKKLYKGFIFGGVESLMGTIIATFFVYKLIEIEIERLFIAQFVIIIIPIFGISVTLAAMGRKRYSLMALLGVVIYFVTVNLI